MGGSFLEGKYDAQWDVGSGKREVVGSHWERSTFGIAGGNKKPAPQIESVQSKNSASVWTNFARGYEEGDGWMQDRSASVAAWAIIKSDLCFCPSVPASLTIASVESEGPFDQK